MTTYINDLEDLEDIMDSLVFEDPPSIFNEDHALDIIETALHLMEEYMIENPTIISEPDFHGILLEEIKEMFYIQMEDYILEDDYIEDDMNDLLEEAFNIYITTFHTERSIEQHHFLGITKESNSIDLLEQKIKYLSEIPQPQQRTDEWYSFRHNLITASNAYKAFESQSTINQLIYEKCQPLKKCDETEEFKMVNVNSTLHWGQKYEPISVQLYEKIYNTKIGDFGCIPHQKYKFLGASPDGINIDKNSDRYGRMLEIKNVVSREINGIPKKEYWIQMQLQMEVCDLDECDFLETKFIEYSDRHSYADDTTETETTHFETGDVFRNECISKDGKQKGVIIYFYTNEGKPFYVYRPLHIIHPKDITEWSDKIVDHFQSAPYNYIYMKDIYWKLEKLSCILVLRNHEWFKNNISQLEKVWKTIEEERKTGYDHRAPNQKPKKDPPKAFVENKSQGCLLNFTKIIKIDTEII